MARRPVTPRTVKPRKRTYKFLPVIALTKGEIYLERTGEILPMSELSRVFRREPASFVAVHGAGRLVQRLDKIFTANPDWQFRLSPVVREVYRPNRERIANVEQKDSVVAFFGFRNATKIKGAGRYFYPLDPIALVNKGIGEIIPGDAPKYMKLLRWAADVRDFCWENGMQPRPTAGGIAGQLLRDPRFYPEPRRKVPAATNEKARAQLPGNYYRLYHEPRSTVNAFYLDQRSAHHTCAAEITFPHADRLHAKGFYSEMPDKPWARRGSKRYHAVLQEFGLFYVKLSCPTPLPERFPPPYMDSAGFRLAYVFSNELPFIRELGGEIEYVIAAWVSPKVDKGLNRYSAWSQDQLRNADSERGGWLKPTLLSTYGILAAKPRPIQFGYKRAVGGERRLYPVGGGRLEVVERATVKAREMPTANVIHRGMIEAETRLRSLRLARELTAHGLTVLSVYADSVFVLDDGTPLPLIADPWQVKGTLTDLQFFTSTAFSSRELEKLPGIPKSDHMRVSRMKSERAISAAVRAGKMKRPARLPALPDAAYELAARRHDFDLTDHETPRRRES